jgi:TolB protein
VIRAGRRSIAQAFAVALAAAAAPACGTSDAAPARLGSRPPAAGAAAPARAPAIDPRRAALAGIIVYEIQRGPAVELWSMPAAGGAPRRLDPGDASYHPAGFRGPDGALVTIAVDEHGADHREQLALIGRGGAVRRLGPQAAMVRHPSRSPDGRWLVVESSVASFRDLYRVDAATGLATRLTDTPAGDFEPALSPDGRTLAFTSSRDGDAEIYTMPAAGGHAHRLTAFYRDDWGAAWSPDGRTLAFLSDREGDARVFLMAPDGTGQRRLTSTPGRIEVADRPDGAAVDGPQEAAPTWSPDGRHLAYVVRSDGAAAVWVADVAPGAAPPRRLSDRADVADAPAWSPDGRHLVYVATRGHRARLVASPVGGGAPIPLTGDGAAVWLPRWIPATR